MQPLAYRVRPKDFDDVIGQDHLVGKKGLIRQMITENKLTSMILYGEAGTGKTTIAHIIMSYYPLTSFEFNASSDNKAKLKEIAEATKFHEQIIVVIDEIHRMNTNTQDFLLSFVEQGKLIMIGLTTTNPYQAINKAIRSRCNLLRLNVIENKDIETLLHKINQKEEFKNYHFEKDVFPYIAKAANNEVRTALNMFELLTLYKDETITLEMAKKYLGLPQLALDDKEDHYYDVLSALQKSIRGSDVDAALHYLARLITLGDLEIIIRRLLTISYEDIGLANPNLSVRVYTACNVAKMLGFPEARIVLSTIVIDLALSPKSNSGEKSIDQALFDYQNGLSGAIPKHILNREIKYHQAEYKYPHDYPDALVKQQYLPDNLKNKTYYQYKETGKYEKALVSRYLFLKDFNKH